MSFEQIDYRHYLEQNKLRESHRFQPIFEAVENAFNSIEERKQLETNPPDGIVSITIHRDNRQRVIAEFEAVQMARGKQSKITSPQSHWSKNSQT